VRSHKEGDVLLIKYRRDGEKREAKATLSKSTERVENTIKIIRQKSIEGLEDVIEIFKDKNGEEKTVRTRKGENDENSTLRLDNYEFYPNSTQNSIKLKFSTESNETITVRLTDANGKEIYQETVKDFNRTYDKSIDLTGKPEGVYVLSIVQGGEQFLRQLVYAKK
jgi:PDZ domain-containing secreted protein